MAAATDDPIIPAIKAALIAIRFALPFVKEGNGFDKPLLEAALAGLLKVGITGPDPYRVNPALNEQGEIADA